MKLFKRCLFLALTLCWMAVIFWFSAQEAEASSGLSGGFIARLLSFILPGFETMDEPSRLALIDSLQTIVRKCAHMGVYAVLGVFVSMFMSTFSFGAAKQFIIALFLCIIYAASDEIHQYFVPGRSCEFRDICIDSVGALIGVSLCQALFYVNKRRRSRG